MCVNSFVKILLEKDKNKEGQIDSKQTVIRRC